MVVHLEIKRERLGRFILFEEQNSTETISFATGIGEGVVVRPGQVIEVSDPVRAGVREVVVLILLLRQQLLLITWQKPI